MLDYAKFVVIFAAATVLAVAAVRHREWRGGLALLSALFLAASMNELESLLRSCRSSSPSSWSASCWPCCIAARRAKG